MAKGNSNIDKWIEGIPYEIAFWNNVYRWKRPFNGLMKWSHYGNVIELECFNASQYLENQSNPTVLDVGAGMSYATGNFVKKGDEKKQLDIHYVDPLAPFFNKILKKYKKNLPEIDFGMMEYLSVFYPENTVDLVIIQNALDHSSNPLKGIFEAIATLRIGGKLYLNHHPNEAETEHYKGFHQFNICSENEKLIIWNKTQRFDIESLVCGFAGIETARAESGHVIAVITKHADVPAELVGDDDGGCMNEDGMKDLYKNLPFGKRLKMRFLYLKYNFIQFMIQGLPWDLRMRIKRLIKQA